MTQDLIQNPQFYYDVCLSYAGEDRVYVGEVHRHLSERGVRVFYDEFEKVDLWGKDLLTHLDDVYRSEARYCVMFISQSYAAKRWTRHERQSAMVRAFEEEREYLLPVRFDDTELPGLRPTVGWLDARRLDAEALATAIIAKIGHQVEAYLPRNPDVLFERLRVRDDPELRPVIHRYAEGVFSTLRMMNEVEREVVYTLFVQGCHSELPQNVHISVAKLARYAGVGQRDALNALADLQPLGIFCHLRKGGDTGHLEEEVLVVLEWNDVRVTMPGNVTMVALEMIWTAREGWCEECGMNALRRLDFSRLASASSPKPCA